MQIVTIGVELTTPREKLMLLKVLNHRVLPALKNTAELYEANIIDFQENGLLMFFHFNEGSVADENNVMQLLTRGMKNEGSDVPLENQIKKQPAVLA